MSNPIKDLLAEIERAKKKSVKGWMTTDGIEAARWIGETCAFEFVIARLKSILAAMKDES